MWIDVLWAGLQVAMWITHVGGKSRHGLLEKSLKIAAATAENRAMLVHSPNLLFLAFSEFLAFFLSKEFLAFFSVFPFFQEWPRQTKPKKGQFMNFSQGHSGTKVQCESCLFS